MPQLRDWLALWRVPGIGPSVFQQLLERFGDPGAVFAAGRRGWGQLKLDAPTVEGLTAPDDAGVERDLAWEEASPHHHILTPASHHYPKRLREIPNPPPLLFVVGDPELLSFPQIGIVGSRRPTAGGRQSARDFAAYLARSGLVITSGLAQGVDTAAHQGALDADGYTIAVTGTGPDRIYPSSNRELAKRIAAMGAIVTEFPTGVTARPDHFPRRNRIISGLGVGVLVVEASLRSGSLITARYALEHGREVFAIPGSIHNPLAKGCHALIRRGHAKLVEQAADILEELPGQLALPDIPGEAEESTSQQTPDAEHAQVMDALGYDPVTLDTVLQRTGLTPEAVSSILLILELQGHVTAMPGGRYARCRPEDRK
ncbi:MAG: DNA-processing protein DprA [Ectothiorhodospiraceae bacterium]|nr:DNA-processing protein DprA [Ectothiorhodospiraceae bacterium]MCH8505629.1 DNA-processing protein DprA [Ectothiorhodospiraceae bacterium]